VKFDEGVTKIGQYPSYADLAHAATAKYARVISPEDLADLRRGIGLAANGIGAGAFVYLRRIFERLIEVEAKKAEASGSLNREEFTKARMAEKVAMLAAELPEWVVQNKVIYSVLSKGIHQLTEDQCLEYFPAVRAAVELMLDAKVAAKEAERKKESAAKALAALSSLPLDEDP
jgi:hypothetical protein